MHIAWVSEGAPGSASLFVTKGLVRTEMAPKEKAKGKGPAPPEAEEADEEAKAKPVLKKETAGEVVQNLLAHGGRIATPQPNKPLNLWPDWTCLHCEKTFYPGKNFTKATVFPSDVANAILKHFREHHGSGPESAYATAAPNRYKSKDARHTKDGQIAPPAKVRRAFASHARGVWAKVRFPSFRPLCTALVASPVCICVPCSWQTPTSTTSARRAPSCTKSACCGRRPTWRTRTSTRTRR